MPGTVAAVPVDLVAFPGRTEAADGDLEAAAGALPWPIGAAVVGHARRARDLAARTGAVGLAFLAAGGPAGFLALAVTGRPVDAAEAAGILGRSSGAPPMAVAWLAAAFGPAVLAELARTRPELVGGLDGMPLETRFEANRELARRAGLDELADPDRHLLLLDVAGGRIAEVVGDVATAEHVAVVVPGMGNDLEHFDVVLDKADAMRRTAAGLDPPEDLAVVAWLGYDSPTVDVLWDGAAAGGGPALVRLVDGLAMANPTATRTVVGHSYGTLVTGVALRSGLDVDAVVLTGSPGVGAGSARELGDTPIYAERAPGDYVSYSEHFGPDPTGPDFGATRLATGDTAGHSGYFDEGGEALRNLTLVAVGRAGAATVLRPGWLETAVDAVDDVHEVTAEAPVDAAQELLDVLGGLAGVPDELLDLGDGVVDLGQRLTSPDLWGDVVIDAWGAVR
jgi:hypothetical protein